MEVECPSTGKKSSRFFCMSNCMFNGHSMDSYKYHQKLGTKHAAIIACHLKKCIEGFS